MIISIVNKLLITLFFLSLLNVLRHAYYFIQAWITSESDAPKKYMLSTVNLWLIGLSIAYVLTTIFTGVRL